MTCLKFKFAFRFASTRMHSIISRSRVDEIEPSQNMPARKRYSGINFAGNRYTRNPDANTKYLYENRNGSRFICKMDGAREYTLPRGPTLRKELCESKYKLIPSHPQKK